MSNRTFEAVHYYVDTIARLAESDIAREHTYRPALVELFNTLSPSIDTFNDPARSDSGQPDFVFIQKSNTEIVRGHGEAKDLGRNLDSVEQTEQLLRYAGYDRLLLTNELEFRFYRTGQLYSKIQIAEKSGSGHISPLVNNFRAFIDEFQAFVDQPPVKITSAVKLAKSMGGKARRVRDYVKEIFHSPGRLEDSDVLKVYEIVKRNLVKGMTQNEFADMYAQTLIYGLFSARFSDPTLETFSRQEARDLIPSSTPFLKTFFDHVAGAGFSPGLAQIVSEMCEIFRVSNVTTIVHRQLSKLDDKDGRDPIIHFYEDFLREYDADQRNHRGAYYTPTPIVRYIIRAVDHALISDLGVSEGLADNLREEYEVPAQPGLALKPGNIRRTRTNVMPVKFHRVQVLDFATGTATFLNELIKYVHRSFEGQEGLWPDYAAEELVPRLTGFELMMAPYAIAHMKLGMTLADLGVPEQQQLRIYLTNTLEAPLEVNPDLFQIGLLEALTAESAAASGVKKERPIMVVLGNPPYSGVSANNFPYANAFIDKYKVEPGGKTKLDERNPRWINNDYVKFLSFAEDLIEKNGQGVLGVITDNSYLMSPTFRGVRWHLANTFDKLMIIDLHGRKILGDKPERPGDENVFEILQGVSILIAIKTGLKPEGTLADVFHAELEGKKKSKFTALNNDDLTWEKLTLHPSMVYFKPTTANEHTGYHEGISLNDLFITKSVGIAAGRDAFTIAPTKSALQARLEDLAVLSDDELQKKYNIKLSGDDWDFSKARADVGSPLDKKKFIPITYRPFDNRWTYYTGNSRGIHTRPRDEVSRHMIGKDNLALCFNRRVEQQKRPFADALTVTNAIQFHALSIKESNYFAPLYTFDETGLRRSNLDVGSVKRLTEHLATNPSDRELFEYVYGVLNDPLYRTLHDESLHLDFPRIPVAPSEKYFSTYRQFGKRLIELHTMIAEDIYERVITFPTAGSNIVERYKFEAGCLWINDHQYFGDVSSQAWNYLIGSYNPAQKWLKDRKNRMLTSEDIVHFQKVLHALHLSSVETQSFESPLSPD